METTPGMHQWIAEALADDDCGRDALSVSRHVWEHHEQELRDAGDLFWTWQIELRDALAALQEQRSAAEAAPRTGPWETDEITIVVDAYVAMLTDEHEGRPVRRREAIADVAARTGRTADGLERMWSNITHVVQEFGYQPLSHWAPRSNVPAGVRPAVAAALGLDLPG